MAFLFRVADETVFIACRYYLYNSAFVYNTQTNKCLLLEVLSEDLSLLSVMRGRRYVPAKSMKITIMAFYKTFQSGSCSYYWKNFQIQYYSKGRKLPEGKRNEA
ncbi:MAG: hypothetical protein HGA72_02210 [Chlorobiaceae bacterium]|nr:hypothetical protein [Chlorobiaceae bacterium]